MKVVIGFEKEGLNNMGFISAEFSDFKDLSEEGLLEELHTNQEALLVVESDLEVVVGEIKNSTADVPCQYTAERANDLSIEAGNIRVSIKVINELLGLNSA